MRGWWLLSATGCVRPRQRLNKERVGAMAGSQQYRPLPARWLVGQHSVFVGPVLLAFDTVTLDHVCHHDNDGDLGLTRRGGEWLARRCDGAARHSLYLTFFCATHSQKLRQALGGGPWAAMTVGAPGSSLVMGLYRSAWERGWGWRDMVVRGGAGVGCTLPASCPGPILPH
jgi:hypothetical protein